MNKIRICLNCNNKFSVRAPSEPNKYCSRECSKNVNLGRKASNETKAKMSSSRKGQKAWNKGIPHTEEAKLNMKLVAPKTKSKEHKRKIGEANSRRIIKDSTRLKRSRENSHFWKGGISTLQNIERNRMEYKNWRKAVYEKDNYCCIVCGTHKNLHAHHIKEFAKYPELRYDINNGQTLCQIHHSEVHGRPIPNIGQVNKKESIVEIIN